MVQVLKQCGDELTRENVMRQAANLKNFELGLLLPVIKIEPTISRSSRCRCPGSMVHTVLASTKGWCRLHAKQRATSSDPGEKKR